MDDLTDVKINAGRARSMVHIISAMLELLIDKKYGEISVTEICELAGVTRKTFYRHFETKRAVIEAALDGMFVEMTQKYNFAETKARFVMVFAFEYLARERRLASIFTESELFEVLIDKIKEYVEYAYDDTLHNASSFEPALADYYYTFVAVGIATLVKTWVLNGCKQSPKVMATLTERLLSGVIS